MIQQLQRIEEFFDELQENLSEVRDYIIVLLEYVFENDDDDMRQMVPHLEKIIELLIQVCPENHYVNGTPGSQDLTPGNHITPSPGQNKQHKVKAELKITQASAQEIILSPRNALKLSPYE